MINGCDHRYFLFTETKINKDSAALDYQILLLLNQTCKIHCDTSILQGIQLYNS